MQTDRLDIYTRVTNTLVAELEKGFVPGSSPGAPIMPPVESPGLCAPTASRTGGCVVFPEPLGKAILVGCNNSVNRYLSLVWRVVFPDQTWCRVGTKRMALQYITINGHRHQG